MTNPLHRFFWEDSEFRAWAYALIAIVGILYATTRTLVFHRPERQIAVELFVLVLVLNSAAVAINYRRIIGQVFLKVTDKGVLINWQHRRGVLVHLILTGLVILVLGVAPLYFGNLHPFIMFCLQVLAAVIAFVIGLLLLLQSGLAHSFPKVTLPQRTYRLSLKVRYGGLVACLILLSAPGLSVSKVQAAIVNQRLAMAASSLEPDKATSLSTNQLKTRFQKIASIASTSTQYKISANPDLVEKVKNNLEETLKSVNPSREDVRRTGVAAFVVLVAYARANNVLIAVNVPTVLLPHGETGNSMISKQVPIKNGAVWWQGSPQGSAIWTISDPSFGAVFPVSHSSVVFNAVNFNAFGMQRALVETDNESQIVIMNATIESAAQKLDAIVWLNIKFKNSQIIYSGGPLYLGDVTFENCQFQFGSDAESQKVLAQIKESGKQPVTLVSGL